MPAKKRFLLAILLIFLLVPIIRADTDAIDYLTAQPGPSSLIRELLAESIERATTTCAARGSVIVNLVKRQYRYNEKIDADVTLINNSTIPTDITYAIRLSKGDIIALEQVRLKSTPPGADKIKIGLLGKTTRFSVPPNIELGRWKLEVIVSMDNCILMGYDYLDVVSCEDNKWNGDEEGADCGGSCPKKCPLPTVVKEPPIEPTCLGCKFENLCLPFGARIIYNSTPSYCSYAQNLEQQRESGGQCQDSYECLSNACAYGTCMNKLETKAKKINTFKKVWCRVKTAFNLFGGNYFECISK